MRPPGRGALNERMAISLVFFAAGLMTVTWVANIPAVISLFKISIKETSFLVMGVGVGALASMFWANAFIRKYGAAPVIFFSGVLAFCIISLSLHLSAYLTLFCALMVFGGATGMVDAAMNAAASAYELRVGRPFLSHFHAFFSLGGMTAAISVWVGARLGSSESLQSSAAAGAALLILALSVSGLRPVAEGAGGLGRKNAKYFFFDLSRVLWILGVLAAVCQVCEGAIHDWSAVLLSLDLGSDRGQAALGLAIYAGCIAASRLAGNWLRSGLGDVRLLFLSSVLTAAPLFWGAMNYRYSEMVLALGLSGLGVANVFPLLISLGTRTGASGSIQTTVWLSLCGYAGFLGGPAFVGNIADAKGMAAAFYAIAVLATVLVIGCVYFAFSRTIRHA